MYNFSLSSEYTFLFISFEMNFEINFSEIYFLLELRDIFGTSDPVCENKVTERVELSKFERFPRFQNFKIMKSNKICYLIHPCKECNDFYMNLFF